MKYLFFLLLITVPLSFSGQQKILFDATKAETAGNADWVIDADQHNLGYPNGIPTPNTGSESNPQQIPTPAQSTVTAATPETYWEGGISAWGIDLVKKGYVTETLPYNGKITYQDASNPQDLSNYKVFVVDEPNIAFTAKEKTAILNFVKDGGGLFMVSDHNNSDRNNDGIDSPHVWNDLLENNSVKKNPFGIIFDYEYFSDKTQNIPNLPGNPLLHGPMGDVTLVEFYGGTSMTLDSTVNNTVTAVVYKSGVSMNNHNVLVAYAEFGKGKVVALGDSSPTDDGTGDPSDKLYDGWIKDANGNHKRLIMNGSIWLAESITDVQENKTAKNIQVFTSGNHVFFKFNNLPVSNNKTLTIFNTAGCEITKIQLSRKQTSYPVHLPVKGVYIYKYYNGNRYVSSKFLY